jgi:light-regulated signal transduction histidine kinase (bacteriophytochrome)
MHRLLQRQLDRHTAGAERVPPEWAAFIEAVDAAYHQADTDRAMLERSLELSSAELLQANGELRGVLHTLADRSRELERSNGELQQFAYIASHDLQEPLRTVQSYLQLLQRRYRDRLDEDADEFIGFAVQGAQRMRELVTDLLAYARVSSRARPFEPTALGEVVQEALGALQAAIAERSAEVTVDALPTVSGDRHQLRQLYQNLVANALKFNRKAVPRVQLGAERQSGGGGWRLWVKDDGIGLDPAYKDKIFEVFKRLYGRDEYEGTGIGLAICKKIVERHGGEIGVESLPDHGSTFWFRLPHAAGDERQA